MTPEGFTVIPKGFILANNSDDRTELINALAIASYVQTKEADFVKIRTIDGKTHYSNRDIGSVSEDLNDAICEIMEGLK